MSLEKWLWVIGAILVLVLLALSFGLGLWAIGYLFYNRADMNDIEFALAVLIMARISFGLFMDAARELGKDDE